jgi:hypothetical protein
MPDAEAVIGVRENVTDEMPAMIADDLLPAW